MPHCIIEYSEGLEASTAPADLINAVFQGALSSGLFTEPDIKTRALCYKHYQTGSKQQEFVHVTLKILSGRTIEQRSDLSEAVLKGLQVIELSDVSLTVEVCNMEKYSYAKAVQ
ncbi:5-carboxymethyl-2-hydroxymuconate Delta-isomerase [Neptunomonas japonica]|uniref:5-carboxymethyl-2-hydroxymuconate isomerase n=1 Tax=Neptunomonas japonica JAMM 1380 TaxID=1441457 RepID=A0A7R6P8W6_9GAMM|nr:5-carboxymethyl-2-hydroxymuconate Delta-isomerase [Neptunomonas japonica]BBB27999.1 5-carboxymethyl-2-hydroxymuconate isomerase [Neptunomonas japonica JAMM 1380]